MKFKKTVSVLLSAVMLFVYGYTPGISGITDCRVSADENTANTNVSGNYIRSGDFGFRKADVDNDGLFEYVSITDYYNEKGGFIIIPDEIGGLPVMGIDNFAFARVENETYFILPKTLRTEYTGNYAFMSAYTMYKNVIVPANSDTLEGVLDYYADKFNLEYTDEKVENYKDKAMNVIEKSERVSDIDSLSVSQCMALLLDEIISGRYPISETKLKRCYDLIETFSYKGSTLFTYHKIDLKSYLKGKYLLKHYVLTPDDSDNKGIYIGDTIIYQGETSAMLDIGPRNTNSEYFDIHIYCEAPLEIKNISGALSAESCPEHGNSCIHGTFFSKGGFLAENAASTAEIAVPPDTALGTYPVFVKTEKLHNDNKGYISSPASYAGSVTISEPPVTTTPATTTPAATITTTTSATTISSVITTVSTSLTSTSVPATTVSSTATTAVTTENTGFVWGRDNWKFINDPIYFPDKNMNEEHYSRLRDNLSNTEWTEAQKLINGYYDDWDYGMSVLVYAAKDLSYSDKDLSKIEPPSIDPQIKSLINYLNCARFETSLRQLSLRSMTDSNETNIKFIISSLEEIPVIPIGYQQDGEGSHTVTAYDVVYGKWEDNGRIYDGKIEIYDPDFFDYDESRCIYFSTSTYDWTIPGKNISSYNGAKFNMYFKGDPGDYLSAIEITPGSHKLEKVTRADDGSFTVIPPEDGEMIPELFFNPENPKGVQGYILKDSNSGYKCSENTAGALKINYENSTLKAVSSADETIFDPSGYISISGNSKSKSDYELSMVFNDDYPTDWYKIEISGTGADNISLQKTENGYMLSGDKLENVRIKTGNDDRSAEFSFGTIYKSAFIYEIDKNTIGVSVDTDGNGTFETSVINGYNKFIMGDVTGNGTVDIYDAITIAKSVIGAKKFNDNEKLIADINLDGKVNIYDAIRIAQIILKRPKY